MTILDLGSGNIEFIASGGSGVPADFSVIQTAPRVTQNGSYVGLTIIYKMGQIQMLCCPNTWKVVLAGLQAATNITLGGRRF